MFVGNHVIDVCDPHDPATYAAAREISQKFLQQHNGDSQFRVSAIGHCHIDTGMCFAFLCLFYLLFVVCSCWLLCFCCLLASSVPADALFYVVVYMCVSVRVIVYMCTYHCLSIDNLIRALFIYLSVCL